MQNLCPETQVLVDQIKIAPIQAILKDTILKKPTDADEKTESKQNESSNQRLSIRLSKADKDRFDRLAKTNNLTQRELLLRLLSKSQTDSDAISLQESTHSQKSRLVKEKTRYKLLQRGISYFYKSMYPTNSIPLEIESGSYANYPNRDRYQYPVESGFFLMRPQAILYGKGRYPARFVLGIGSNDSYIKVRWYPTNHFIGISLLNKQFSCGSSVWLIGCEQAADGAMDLFAALPLNISSRYRDVDEHDFIIPRFDTDITCKDEGSID